MSKSRTKETQTQQEEAQDIDISALDQEQQFELICSLVEGFCTSMEQRSVDPHMLNIVLLEAFCSRMAEVNDRERYEELLQEAIDAEWDDVTIH